MPKGYFRTKKIPLPRITAEQLLSINARLAHRGYELDHGTLTLCEPAGCLHGDIAGGLYCRLKLYVQSRQLGCVLPLETGFIISRNPDTVLGPDVAFIQKHRIPTTGLPTGYFEGPPDLAVEVMSPHHTFPTVDRKLAQYIEAGTRLVWGIRPQGHTAWIKRADGSGMYLPPEGILSGEQVIPGFTCSLEELFLR